MRHPPRPLLCLRRKPGRLALAVFRMPLRAYRHDAGWLLGHTFLLLVHAGRKTGQPHSTVAMVLRYDGGTREAVICSGWGPDADWVSNLRAGPAVQVQLGRESYIPEHRFLSEDESFEVAVQFRGEHPWRLRLIGTILGWGDLCNDTAARDFTRTHPFVALRPALSPRRPERPSTDVSHATAGPCGVRSTALVPGVTARVVRRRASGGWRASSNACIGSETQPWLAGVSGLRAAASP